MTSSTSNGQNKSLFDRVEMPEVDTEYMLDIPSEARQGLARLGEEFARAEVEIRRFNPKLHFVTENRREAQQLYGRYCLIYTRWKARKRNQTDIKQFCSTQ
jgi:hypothetical protein